MHKRISPTVAILILSLAADALAEPACVQACRGDTECVQAVTRWQQDDESVRAAIERLKSQVSRHPDDSLTSLCLAKAYLADDNPFWSVRTLLKAIDNNPSDCANRAWLAWTYLGQGFVDPAEDLLDPNTCSASEPDKTRRLLLTALIARARNLPQQAQKSLQLAWSMDAIYPEDQALWQHLNQEGPSNALRPLSLKAEIVAGYTSNAVAGSPTDPAFTGPASSVGRIDLFGELVWPTASVFSPVVQAGMRGLGLVEAGVSELSYVQLNTRPGLMLTLDPVRLVMGYRLDAMRIDREDIEWFAIGHRGELEIDTAEWLLFAGAGHRTFHQAARSRTELDAGAGGTLLSGKRLRVLGAGTVRSHWAEDQAYDLLGSTLQLAAWLNPGADVLVRLGVTLGADWYPHSGGAFGVDQERFELFSRLSAGIWSPDIQGVRLGASYECAWRDSTADRPSMNFDYTEHRVLFGLRVSLNLDPWAPTRVHPASHVHMDFGLGGPGEDFDEERIQDLLRRDEADRRGVCGCGS